MQEIISQRKWDAKKYDTGKTLIDDKGVEQVIYGSKLQNGLHDIEPNGSFVDCNPSMRDYVGNVSTLEAIRGRYGSLRAGDTGSESKDRVKILTKRDCGISLKLCGHRTYGPWDDTIRKIRFDTNDGITLNYYPSYKGVNIVITIDNPQTAFNKYTFSIKEYGCTYEYVDIEDGIHCVSSTGKDDVFIKATYVVDSEGNYGPISIKKGLVVDGYQEAVKTIDPIWLGNAVGPVFADPDVTIDDDSGTLIDTLLYDLLPANNYGIFNAGQCLHRTADRVNELVKVDLSGITGTAISGYFALDVNNGSVPVTIEWNRVLKTWIEGTKNGAGAANGEPTWNSQAHNEATWTTGGCLGDGTDRQAVAEGSKTITAFGSDQQLAMTTTTMQAWLDNLADNHGVVISAPNLVDSRYIQWPSSEAVSGEKIYFYLEYTETVSGDRSPRRLLLLLNRRKRK